MSASKTQNYKKIRSADGKVRYKKSSAVVAGTLGSASTRIIRIIGRTLAAVWHGFTSKWILALLGSLMLTGIIGIIMLLIMYARVLPDISGLAASKESPGMEVLAQDGSLITRYGQISGKYIAYKDIPPDLVKAVIATEDRRFFDHFGVDPLGVIRAMIVNFKTGRFVQGGSTVTQQLAKNLFLTTERTFERKIQELMMSFWLEEKFTKQEIMSIYLNRVYFGAGSYGIDSAARVYFDKDVHELTLVESAMLAGLLKAPSRYNPMASPARAKGRTRQVILNMQNAGFVTSQETENALQQLTSTEHLVEETTNKKEVSDPVKQITFNDTTHSSKNYFSDWVQEEVERILGEVKEDVIVSTTLNTTYQNYADKAIADYLTEKVRTNSKVSEVALLAMRPNGAVVAMVGGRDYETSQYNRVTQAMRQPGSAFKMFVYLAALQKGHEPGDMFEDKAIRIGKWSPKNYNNKYRGSMNMQDAMAHSVNTIAVRLSRLAGMGNVIKVAKKLGVKSAMMNAPSLALGASEMTLQELVTAYAHLANNGRSVQPYGVSEIKRKRDNKVLYSRTDADNYSDVIAIKEENVAKMNTLLSAVLQKGTAKSARIGRDAAGKTGTTSNYKDAWFVGYTPHMVAGVWVGNDNATPMRRVTGGNIPARIWKSYMKASHKGVKKQSLPKVKVAAPVIFNDGAVTIKDGVYVPPKSPSAPKASPNRSGKTKNGYELDKGFWNKLFDKAPNADAIKYEYPSDRRR